MRLEGQRRRRPAERPGARERGRDHGAVAAMHAVEIADGDDRARKRLAGRRRRAPRRTAASASGAVWSSIACRQLPRVPAKSSDDQPEFSATG